MFLGQISHCEDHCYLIRIIRVEVMGSRARLLASLPAPPLTTSEALVKLSGFRVPEIPEVKCGNNNSPHGVVVGIK